VGPNELPTPAITVQNFQATGTIGSAANLSAKVLSSGTAPASVTIHLFLGTANQIAGEEALANDIVTYHNLAPGSSVQLSRALGAPLKKGSYKAILTWRDQTGAPHMLESDFTATSGKSWLQKIWDWIKNHWWLFLILLILALLAVLAYLLNKQRQRRRQLEAELAAARAGTDGSGGGESGQPPARGPPEEPPPPFEPAAEPVGAPQAGEAANPWVPPEPQQPAPPAQPQQPAPPAQAVPPPAPPAAVPPTPPQPPAEPAPPQPPPQPPPPPPAAAPPPTPPPPTRQPPPPAPQTALDALQQLRRRAGRRIRGRRPPPPRP
jgi:hypothetical protein